MIKASTDAQYMLTAKADMASKMQGLEGGAHAYLAKPFNREELLMRIKKLLELRRSLQQYSGKKPGLQMNKKKMTEAHTANSEVLCQRGAKNKLSS